MPRLKRLSQKEVINILESFNFSIKSQKGSHIKMRKKTEFGFQVLTVPNHKEIDIGTLKAIFNQASKFIPRSELQKHFFNK